MAGLETGEPLKYRTGLRGTYQAEKQRLLKNYQYLSCQLANNVKCYLGEELGLRLGPVDTERRLDLDDDLDLLREDDL